MKIVFSSSNIKVEMWSYNRSKQGFSFSWNDHIETHNCVSYWTWNGVYILNASSNLIVRSVYLVPILNNMLCQVPLECRCAMSNHIRLTYPMMVMVFFLGGGVKLKKLMSLFFAGAAWCEKLWNSGRREVHDPCLAGYANWATGIHIALDGFNFVRKSTSSTSASFLVHTELVRQPIEQLEPSKGLGIGFRLHAHLLPLLPLDYIYQPWARNNYAKSEVIVI